MKAPNASVLALQVCEPRGERGSHQSADLRGRARDRLQRLGQESNPREVLVGRRRHEEQTAVHQVQELTRPGRRRCTERICRAERSGKIGVERQTTDEVDRSVLSDTAGNDEGAGCDRSHGQVGASVVEDRRNRDRATAAEVEDRHILKSGSRRGRRATTDERRPIPGDRRSGRGPTGAIQIADGIHARGPDRWVGELDLGPSDGFRGAASDDHVRTGKRSDGCTRWIVTHPRFLMGQRSVWRIHGDQIGIHEATARLARASAEDGSRAVDQTDATRSDTGIAHHPPGRRCVDDPDLDQVFPRTTVDSDAPAEDHAISDSDGVPFPTRTDALADERQSAHGTEVDGNGSRRRIANDIQLRADPGGNHAVVRVEPNDDQAVEGGSESRDRDRTLVPGPSSEIDLLSLGDGRDLQIRDTEEWVGIERTLKFEPQIDRARAGEHGPAGNEGDQRDAWDRHHCHVPQPEA